MKTNFYILLTLLFTFSICNAQSTVSTIEVESNNVISVSKTNDDVVAVTSNTLNEVNKKEDVLIDASQFRESIARTNSDIRIYFNRLRDKKVDNIKILFPKINKATKA
ncbi:hypothetical protein [Algibacter aquimarinus]